MPRVLFACGVMQLTPLLGDHAVLQRDRDIPVWGWTAHPRARLRASLGPARAEGVSGDDGRFLLRLPPLPAGGPHVLRVETLDGSDRVECRDILIGEVWLASGQSNMEWSMGDCAYAGEITSAHPGQIRMFNVKRRVDLAPQSTVAGEWQLASPETMRSFSAVANFFGQSLQDSLDVPVGIVNASMGGTFIESWISRERLLANAETRDWVVEYERVAYHPDYWGEQIMRKNRMPVDPGNLGVAAGWHSEAFDDTDWQTIPVPSAWQDHGHNYSGIVWYRKRVTLPPSLQGRTLRLQPGRIDKQDITYVNGREIGRTGTGLDESFWNVARDYEIPAEVTSTSELVIAIRAYSFFHHGGLIGPADIMCVTDEDACRIPLDGDWRITVEHNLGLQDLGPLMMGHGVHNSPSMCFENMIRPLLPTSLAGVIWYQGESNAERAPSYRRLLGDLILDWRYLLAREDLPFGIVQLANYRPTRALEPHSDWARIREAQQDALTLPHTGLAVILDCGDAVDIHPRNKKTVGLRLAAWALNRVYGRGGPSAGPMYREARPEGDRLRLLFDHTAEGLAFREGLPPVTLIITDGNSRFAHARCEIDGHTLLVWHEDIPSPKAVYYAWADNPHKATLENSVGLPAAPFRTDRNPLLLKIASIL